MTHSTFGFYRQSDIFGGAQVTEENARELCLRIGEQFVAFLPSVSTPNFECGALFFVLACRSHMQRERWYWHDSNDAFASFVRADARVAEMIDSLYRAIIHFPDDERPSVQEREAVAVVELLRTILPVVFERMSAFPGIHSVLRMTQQRMADSAPRSRHR